MLDRIAPLVLSALVALALAGCGQRVNTAFAGVALAGLLLVVTLSVLNYLARGKDSKKAQTIRAVVIALLLCTMIGMLVLIVIQADIGKI